MENSKKLCPNCNRELAPAGVNSANELAYQCGHCLLTGGTLAEMARIAIEKKKRVEATASLFKCKMCNESVPSTKINLADTFPTGMLELIHVCDDCMPLLAISEAKRREKINDTRRA